MKTVSPFYLPLLYESLYPTFKEWKQEYNSFNSLILVVRLYPTFKEWKQHNQKYKKMLLYAVYILPLRNENTFSTLSTFSI